MNNGKMIFVTGSAMSGKSRFGVSQFKEMDRVQYLCTNEDMDDKTLNRIFFNERSKHFRWDIIRNFSVDKTLSNTRSTSASCWITLQTGYTKR